MNQQIRCKVFRTTCDYAFDESGDRHHLMTNSWWTSCKYDWGTVDTLHPTWKNAMLHVNDEITRIAAIAEQKWNR